MLNYELKGDLILPAKGDLSAGYFLFPAAEFGVTFFVHPNPRTLEINISLQVYDLATEATVYEIGTWKIVDAVDGGYNDVITYLNPDGTWNSSGVTFFKTLSFQGSTLGDYIV